MKNKVMVIGAARSGVAVAALLAQHNVNVILTDNRIETEIVSEFPQIKEELMQLDMKRIETIFGKQISPSVLPAIDYIVLSPGVPLTIPVIQEACKAQIPVLSEVELAYRLAKAPFVAITGTNGKTTTTALTGEIFKRSGRKTYTVGNIGDPVSHYVDEAKTQDIFVAEISAFQLDTIIDFKPKVAALLNISPDHLDRYKTMEKYIEAKERIFLNQTEEDYLVLNADDKTVCEIAEGARSKKLYFSLEQKVDDGAFAAEDKLYIADKGSAFEICEVDDLFIKGPHNVANALAAASIAYYSGVDIDIIAAAFHDFKGVAHRQEFVATVKGVDYINDSKGTNTNAAITALNAMVKPVILIAGGYDKNEDYTALMKAAKAKVKGLILLGETGEKIKAAAEEQDLAPVIQVADYDEAVKKAAAIAEPGDAVLLSPACASWDMFDNYEIRGDIFKQNVLRMEGAE